MANVLSCFCCSSVLFAGFLNFKNVSFASFTQVNSRTTEFFVQSTKRKINTTRRVTFLRSFAKNFLKKANNNNKNINFVIQYSNRFTRMANGEIAVVFFFLHTSSFVYQWLQSNSVTLHSKWNSL